MARPAFRSWAKVGIDMPELCRAPNEYNSFAFTVRPKNGMIKGSNLENAIVSWCKKQDYYFLCSEKEDEARHLHGQIWNYNSSNKSVVTRALKRMYEKHLEDCDPAQLKVLSSGVKIAYSKDWTEEYLSKEDGWLLNNPPELEHLFYPSLEEQEKVKASTNAVDKYFHRVSEMFKEYYPEYKLLKDNSQIKDKVIDFLNDAMFISKTITVIREKRKRIELRQCLTYYIFGGAREAFMTKEEIESVSQVNIEDVAAFKQKYNIE